jgi:hypothetical protein
MRLHYTKVGILTDDANHPLNPRGLPGETAELEEQIERDGQRTPISVTRPNTKGIHFVTRGHRRKRAIDNLRTQYLKFARDLQVQIDGMDEDTDPQYFNAYIKNLDEAKARVERYSYYDVVIKDIDADDIDAALSDIDAGIIQEPVNPVALGEAMMYRMEVLGWTFQRCYESLGMREAKARACFRAADPQQTPESVRRALRTGELSLSLFIKKFSKMDIERQDKVMKLAADRAEGKRAGGSITPNIVNAVISDLSGEAEMPAAPDDVVLPALGQARDLIYDALRLRSVWSEATQENAEWLLEEILLAIGNDLKQQERGRP